MLSSDENGGKLRQTGPPKLYSKIHGNGKCSIPGKIRRKWGVKDGDYVVWDPLDHVVKVYPAELTIKKVFLKKGGIGITREWNVVMDSNMLI